MIDSKFDIALIPAREGSVRLPGKNTKPLNAVPLIAYAIRSALDSNIFEEVIVSTDSPEIAEIAQDWGAKVPNLRPKEFASNESTDLEWITHAVENLVSIPRTLLGCLAIIRPTNPLRKASTIKRAMEAFKDNGWADSLRAMDVTYAHPGKMWRVDERMRATTYLDQNNQEIPTHNRPTQSLERLWLQNASLEIIKSDSFFKTGSISGDKVMAFQMPDYEGFDLNTPLDWKLLEVLVNDQPHLLPIFKKKTNRD